MKFNGVVYDLNMRAAMVDIDYFDFLNNNVDFKELKKLYKNVVVKSLRLYGIKMIDHPSVIFVKDRVVPYKYAIATGDFIDGEVKNYVDIENPTGTLTIASYTGHIEAIYYLIFEFRLDIGRLNGNNLAKMKMFGDDFSAKRKRIVINSNNVLDLIEDDNEEEFRNYYSQQPVGLDISLNKSKVSKNNSSSKYNIVVEERTKFKKNNNDVKMKKKEKGRNCGNNSSRLFEPGDIDSSELSD
jgi:hypothetical protein